MQLKYHNAQKSQYPQTKMPFLEVPFHFLAFCAISYHSVPLITIHVVFCRFMPFFLTCSRPFKLKFLVVLQMIMTFLPTVFVTNIIASALTILQ